MKKNTCICLPDGYNENRRSSKLSNPKTIAKACQIAEGGGYMRDYVEDEKGRIARVDFDFVKEK